MPKSSDTITREQAAAERKTSLLRGKSEDRHGLHLARGTHPIDVDVRRVLTFSLRMQAVERNTAQRPEPITFPGTAAIRSAPPRVQRAPEDADGEDKEDKDEPIERDIESAADDDDKNRDESDDKESFWCHLSGVASVVETPYQMWDIFGPYTEKVSTRAFDASLSRGPDVAFLVNHSGLTMARTRAGTLLLASSPSGLAIDAWLNKNRNDVADLAIAIKEGSVDQMSFAAFLEEGEWNEDFSEFTILRLDLDCGDVSAVNFGANPHTNIAHRALQLLDDIDNLPERVGREALKKLELRYGSPNLDQTKQASGRSLALVRSALLASE
jgi:HK97 family phage prohead protease